MLLFLGFLTKPGKTSRLRRYGNATGLILTWQLNKPTGIHHPVIPEKAGIQ